MKLHLVTKKDYFKSLDLEERPWQDNYLAMYSTLWQGVVTDPHLMMVPMDDHLVHRGDGVFDVIRCVEGKIYQLEAHLQRLEGSAKAISLPMPAQYKQVREIVKALIVKCGVKDCIIRIILSRGPGGFSTNPFECPSSQMYINIIRYQSPPEKYYQEGISTVTSQVPIKNAYFARIKSCNYLPNVLMKMEALNRGCPYAVGVDNEDGLAEGSTENVVVLTRDDILKFPHFARTLAGITAKRVFELAEVLVRERQIAGVRFDPIPLDDAHSAKEMMLLGTSINVLPIVGHDGRQVGQGVPGPVYRKLSDLLQRDMTENAELLTEP
jgi:branched-subunit amino acid aminotransferase/4-amino-4-deoxychorismate lyase